MGHPVEKAPVVQVGISVCFLGEGVYWGLLMFQGCFLKDCQTTKAIRESGVHVPQLG